jgi:hypothetical protein
MDMQNNSMSTSFVVQKALPPEPIKIEETVDFPRVDNAHYFKAFDVENTVLYSKSDLLSAKSIDTEELLVKILVPAGVNEIVLHNNFSSSSTFNTIISQTEIPAELCLEGQTENCFEPSDLKATNAQIEVVREGIATDKAFFVYLHLHSSDLNSELKNGNFSTLMMVDDVTLYESWRGATL